MRHSPSTSMRAVPSGNFTILASRETQPTSYKSSGWGSTISGLRCSTAPSRRSPATMSSINFRLGPVSTSSGTTAPGKMTMSDRPSTGRFSGKERAEMREGASDFSAPPRILTNSVSGEVIVVSIKLDAVAREKIHARLISFGNRNFRALGLHLVCQGHVNPQKSVHVNRLGLGEVVSRRQFEHAFERAVVDFHDQKIAFVRAAHIRPAAADAQPVAFDGDLEILAFHPGQLHLDDQAGVGLINIGVRNPAAVGRVSPPADRRTAGNKMHGGTDFGDCHDKK